MAISEASREFGTKLLQIYTGAMLSNRINIGCRTGLFEAAAGGPATIGDRSIRAGLNQRYVREWLGAMTTAGIVDHDPVSATFALPPERAVMLTGARATNLAVTSGAIARTRRRGCRVLSARRRGRL